MSKVQINKNENSFILNGKPFFYLADTVWSAFTNITMEEWEFYLDKRKNQGFNVLQINTLPQWDRSMSDIGIYPFATEDGQKFEFAMWNEAYYERAKVMCQMAVDYGFQLALVVLWLNFVPGTWGSKYIDMNIMPEDFVEKYTQKVYEEFEQFDPIYVISGDTDFDTPEAISYYKTALDKMCELSPDSLKTFHIKRGYDYIPQEFLDKIDFYMFQSGHNVDGQDMAYILAETFYDKYPKKPIINAEPCYEQMGYSRQVYGRFKRFDVRKAAWSSLLSGASAGVTYGAHGVWNWHKVNKLKNPVLGEGFDEPLPWEEALRLMGAWDYGYIRYLFEHYEIEYLQPANDLLENNTKEIRLAKSDKGIYLLYVPSNTKIVINEDLSDYEVKLLDLAKKNIGYPNMQVENKKTTIEMHRFERDVLIAAKRKKF